MKAPDKIYLEKSLSNPDRLHSQWYPNDVIGNGIEYIRKDALLEWLEEQLQELNNTPSQQFEYYENGKIIGGLGAFEQVIDKLNSM